MALTKLQFKPGIFRDNTQYSGEGGWYDCDKVRFRLGFPEQIGGWVNFLPGQTYEGVCRSLHQWTALDFNDYISLATHLKWYLIFQGALYDITPIRRTVTLGADPFTTQTASPQLIVHDVAHGALINDFVTISGATAFDVYTTGNLNQEFQITSIIDADNYTVDVHLSPSSGGLTGGGAVVQAEYQINVGLADSSVGTGYGAGPYGAMAYGTYYTSTIPLRAWHIDNFGEDLIGTYEQGDYYYWDKSASTDAFGTPTARAVVLSSVAGANSVPTVGLSVGVSDSDRHVIAFGCDDYGAAGVQDLMLVRWCAQESLLDWEPRADNTSGSLRLSLGSRIVGYQKTRSEFLVWTDRALYSLHFVGPPYYYAITQISDSVTLIGSNASVEGNGVVFWSDYNSFYLYNGAVQVLDCPVREFVFRNINADQSSKVTAGVNSRFNEVIWFYPSSTSHENDRYVLFNYVEGTWAIGTMERTAWADLAFSGHPLATSATNIYEHEVGWNDDQSAMYSYLESCDFDISDGQNFVFARRCIPDVVWTGATGGLGFYWKMRDYPTQTPTLRASFGFDPSVTGVPVDIRMRGRQVILRVDSTYPSAGWRLGTQRLDIQPDGKR